MRTKGGIVKEKNKVLHEMIWSNSKNICEKRMQHFREIGDEMEIEEVQNIFFSRD